MIPFEPAFAGRYWDDRQEIDWLVLDRTRTQAAAVEIKWTQAPINAARGGGAQGQDPGLADPEGMQDHPRGCFPCWIHTNRRCQRLSLDQP